MASFCNYKDLVNALKNNMFTTFPCMMHIGLTSHDDPYVDS